MAENTPKQKIYRFDEFELNSNERLLLRDGERVSITPRMFDLLVRLVRADGHLVNKEILLNEVWSDAAVEEGNLNRTISALRKTLGETKNENRFIETVPKIGYRFVANVETIERNGERREGEKVRKTEGERKSAFRIPKSAIAVGVFVLLFASLLGLYFIFRKPVENSTVVGSVKKDLIRLTDNKFDEDAAEWMGDNRLRFTRIANNKGQSYMMNADGSEQIRANTEIKNLKGGIWSPDGKKVLFNKEGEDARILYLANSDGSNEIKFPFPPASTDWSPDSASLVTTVNYPPENGGAEIVIYTLETGKITNISNHSAFDANPSFSRDGRQILFNSDRDGNHEIYLMNADGSGVRRLTNNPAREAFQAFSPDGTQIVFNSNRENEKVGIYLMNVNDDAQPIRLSDTKYNAEIRPRCWSPDGTQIVFTGDSGGNNFNIYAMNVEPFKPELVFAENSNDLQFPAFSPDGKQIVYSAKLPDASGELRLLNLETKTSRTLLKTENTDLSPSFSTDGSKIIFGNKIAGNTEICTIKTDGTNLQNLSNHPARDAVGVFTPDGNEIVFTSERDGNAEGVHLFRMNADGSNQRRITEKSGYEISPAIAPDGKSLIFAGDRADGKSRGLDIFWLNLQNQSEEKILAGRRFHDSYPTFSPNGKRIAFTATSDGNSEIYLMNADGTGLLRLTRNAAEDFSPQFSKDGKRIIFSSNRDGKFAIYEIEIQ